MNRNRKVSSSRTGRRKTLDRVISQAAAGSRADARRWVEAGRVRVNGAAVTSPDQWVDPEHDRITLNGKPLRRAEPVYLLLYKPKGYITTRHDPEGRSTVFDLVSDREQFLIPVGRLDQDTSGLLLLTNDTLFADHVTDPESHLPKTYLVKTASILPESALDLLRQGIELDDGPARPAQVSRIRDTSSSTFFEIAITEGRNRQVRRMVEAAGSRVRKLVRTAIGPLTLAGLEIGRYRELTRAEVNRLMPPKPSRAGTPLPRR